MMITLYGIGRLIQKRSSTLNVLAASALIMLFFEPHLLFQLSFQFSFMALTGIVFFFPLLKSKVRVFNLRIPDRILDGILITVSAQISLLPLLLFYFQEFPIYSIVGSVPSILAVPLIMATGVFMVVAGLLVPVLGEFVGVIHQYIIQALIQIMEVIGTFQGAFLEVFQFSFYHVILVFIILSFGYMIWLKKTKLKLFAFFVINLVFIGSLSSIQTPNSKKALLNDLCG